MVDSDGNDDSAKRKENCLKNDAPLGCDCRETLGRLPSSFHSIRMSLIVISIIRMLMLIKARLMKSGTLQSSANNNTYQHLSTFSRSHEARRKN